MARIPQRPEIIFDQLKDKYGHYIIYARTDTRHPCSCRDPDTEEANPKHTVCLGLGYKITLERWPVIDAKLVPSSQLPFLSYVATIGRVGPEGRVFYSQREMWPKRIDRFYHVEWSVPKRVVLGAGRVIRLVDIYEVNDVDHIRFQGGEVVLHQIYAKSLEVDYEWTENALKSKTFTRVTTEFDERKRYRGQTPPSSSVISYPVGGIEPPSQKGEITTSRAPGGGGSGLIYGAIEQAGLPVSPAQSLVSGSCYWNEENDRWYIYDAEEESWKYVVLAGHELTPTLESLENVGTVPTDGQVLTFNATTGMWEPEDITAGGEPVIDPGTTGQFYRGDKSWANTLLGGLSLNNDIAILIAGNGIKIKEGTNAKQGTATLVYGAATAPNTAVTANSRILLTPQDDNTIGNLRISARVPGTSFTITSTNLLDSGLVGWEIFEPA